MIEQNNLVTVKDNTQTPLLTTKEVLKLLGIGATSWWKITKTDPTAPKHILIGQRRKAYRADEINAWLESRRGITPQHTPIQKPNQ